MTAHEPQFLARIGRLETSVRRWRRMTFCIFGILGVLLLLGSQIRQAIVEAERFILVDGSGNRRAVLHSDAAGPILGMVDARGNPRLTLTVTEEGPRLSLYDSPRGCC